MYIRLAISHNFGNLSYHVCVAVYIIFNYFIQRSRRDLFLRLEIRNSTLKVWQQIMEDVLPIEVSVISRAEGASEININFTNKCCKQSFSLARSDDLVQTLKDFKYQSVEEAEN